MYDDYMDDSFKRNYTPKVEELVDMVESILSSKTKRHIVGGVLLSVSFLFGGLAITCMTVKEDCNEK